MKEIKRAVYMVLAIIMSVSTVCAISTEKINIDNPIKIDISGTAQVLFTKSELDSIDKQFDFHRARLGIGGKLNDNVSFFTEFEMTGNISPQTAWTAKPDNRINLPPTPSSSVAAGARYAQKDMGTDGRLTEGYIELKYFKKLKLIVGQMARGSCFELNTPVNQLETIHYSTNVGQFGKYTRGFRIIGSPFSFLKIAVGIDDNAGGITGAIDSSDSKLSAGVKFLIIPWKNHWQIKLCTRRVSETPTSPDGNCLIGGTIFKYAGFHFMGEIFNLHANPINTGINKEIKGDLTSWFLHASYIIPGINLQLVTRYNYFEKRLKGRLTNDLKHASNYNMEILTTGVNWLFSDHARLQIMFDRVDGQDNNSIDAQLEVSF